MALTPRFHTKWEQDEYERKLSERVAPPFHTHKGLQFFAQDSDGQWYYVNHANTWQTCPPPFPPVHQ